MLRVITLILFALGSPFAFACGQPFREAVPSPTAERTPSSSMTGAVVTARPLVVPTNTPAPPPCVMRDESIAPLPATQAPAGVPDANALGIYRYDIDSDALTKISHAPTSALAWDDDRAIWYTTRPFGEGDVRRLDLCTGGDELIHSLGRGMYARLYPDQGRAVFSRLREGVDPPEYGVWLFEEGVGETDLADGFAPGLSPDGSMLSYTSPTCSGGSTLKVKDLTRGMTPIVVPELQTIRRAWLADGRLAVRVRLADEMQTWLLVEPRTSTIEPLRDLMGGDDFIDLSVQPDVTHAVLQLDDSPATRFVMRDLASGEETPLVGVTNIGDGWDGWSRDGTRVAVAEASAVAVWSSDGVRTDRIELSIDRESGVYPASSAWSPDGTQLVFSLTHGGRGVCD